MILLPQAAGYSSVVIPNVREKCGMGAPQPVLRRLFLKTGMRRGQCFPVGTSQKIPARETRNRKKTYYLGVSLQYVG
jgi:hypothetical protein